MSSKTKAQRKQSNPDYVLILVVAGLVVIGLMMVYSTTFDWSYQQYQNSFHIASRQFLWVGIGTLALVVVTAVPYDFWQRMAVPVLGVALLLLILVLILGQTRFGARRSFFNGSIQPSELAKPALVIYVAAWLASKGDQIRDVTYGLIPFSMLIGVVAGLVMLQPDMGTAALIVLTAFATFFFAGADIFQLAIGGAMSGVTFYLLVNQLAYAKQRLSDYLLIQRDPMRLGHHIQQSLIALGSGGVFGVGLGQGQQKLGYLPTPHTDAIFAMLGEEAGLVGCLLVIGLFVLLTYRGFRIALEAQDAFAALMACGVTAWLTFQALINVAVMTGLLPFTGIALPFISSGGSAMVTSLIGAGLLLSISRGKRGKRRHKARGYTTKGSRRYANLDRRWGNRGTRLSRPRRRTGPSC